MTKINIEEITINAAINKKFYVACAYHTPTDTQSFLDKDNELSSFETGSTCGNDLFDYSLFKTADDARNCINERIKNPLSVRPLISATIKDARKDLHWTIACFTLSEKSVKELLKDVSFKCLNPSKDSMGHLDDLCCEWDFDSEEEL